MRHRHCHVQCSGDPHNKLTQKHEESFLLIFMGKRHIPLNTWKSLLFSLKIFTTTTTTLEIVEDFACGAKNITKMRRFRIFHASCVFLSFFHVFLFILFSLLIVPLFFLSFSFSFFPFLFFYISSFYFLYFFSRPSRTPKNRKKNGRQVPTVKMTIFLCDFGASVDTALGLLHLSVTDRAFMFFVSLFLMLSFFLSFQSIVSFFLFSFFLFLFQIYFNPRISIRVSLLMFPT